MPKITISHSDGREERFALQGKLFKIGRAPDNDIILPDGASSNYHAVLKITEGGDFAVTDLGSTNHTKVNGRRVTTVDLHDGDRILFGDTLALYSSDIRSGQGRTERTPGGDAPTERRPLPDRHAPGAELPGSRRREHDVADTERLTDGARKARRSEAPQSGGGGGCLGMVALLLALAALLLLRGGITAAEHGGPPTAPPAASTTDQSAS